MKILIICLMFLFLSSIVYANPKFKVGDCFKQTLDKDFIIDGKIIAISKGTPNGPLMYTANLKVSGESFVKVGSRSVESVDNDKNLKKLSCSETYFK